MDTPNSLKETYDINPGFGGPLKRDRLWFFATIRRYVMQNYAGGAYYNLNANNPNVWTYAPDLSRPAFNSLTRRTPAVSLRSSGHPKPSSRSTRPRSLTGLSGFSIGGFTID